MCKMSHLWSPALFHVLRRSTCIWRRTRVQTVWLHWRTNLSSIASWLSSCVITCLARTSSSSQDLPLQASVSLLNSANKVNKSDPKTWFDFIILHLLFSSFLLSFVLWWAENSSSHVLCSLVFIFSILALRIAFLHSWEQRLIIFWWKFGLFKTFSTLSL